MAYEALYRRYRPGRFEDMIGQEHVFATLKNSLINDRVGHAYLFSGPRGTGKTSSARILAKALNCTNLTDGEPCDACDSCLAFASGQSYDLYELDAASNNGVENMRDLIQKVALGSPGRKKVYILDEAHMLSTGAENALLKTLEEPPSHVTFVLCTTEPNKVVATIRSRTQHLEFRLYPAEELADLARSVAADAGLDVDEEGIAYAVRAARGSARDMLSALDQVAAAGAAPEDSAQTAAIIAALAARDTGAALVAVNDATRIGRDPETIGRSLLTELRNAFLASMRADLAHMSDTDRADAQARSEIFGPAAITRAIEALGTALVDMRQAPDPRVDLEVTLVRLTRPELDTDSAALVERIERLERGAPPAAPAPAVAAAAPAKPVVHPAADAESVEPAVAPAAAAPAPAPAAPSGPVAVAPAAAASAPAPAAPSGPVAAAPLLQSAAPAADSAAAETSASKRPADAARQMLPRRPGRGDDSEPVPAAPEHKAAEHKATLGNLRRSASTTATEPPPVAASAEPTTSAPPAPEPAADAEEVSVHSAPVAVTDANPETVAAAWNEKILGDLPGSVKARFSAGHFRPGAEGLEFALPNEVHRQRCEEVRGEVDQSLAAHFGAPVPVTLVVGEPAAAPSDGFAGGAPTAEELLADEVSNVHELLDAGDDVNNSVIDRIEQVFPGSEFIQDE